MQEHKMKARLSSYSQDVFTAAGGSRPNVKKVLIVITDGESQDGPFLGRAVYSAEQKKIVRFAFGVRCMHIDFIYHIYTKCIPVNGLESPAPKS